MNRVNDTERKYIIFYLSSRETLKETFTDKGLFPQMYPPKREDEYPRPFCMGKKENGPKCELTSGEEIHVDPLGKLKKKKKENRHKLYDVYLPLVRLRTSMNFRNDIFGQRMPDVVVVYRLCHGFRRHPLSRQTCDKLQCLYENLMSNNFRKTAFLKKRSIVN